jgi:hypothetical protein
LEAGRVLIEVSDSGLVPRGEWRHWVEAAGVPYRTARHYMQNYREITGAIADRTANLQDVLEASLSGAVRMVREQRALARREESRAASPIADGMEYRVGDCCDMLNDIEDNSVAAIITDPPYGNAATPLYEWLAAFTARVLVPGGSLICYSGTGTLPRDYRIFDAQDALKYWWTPIMLHGDAHKMFGAGVRANHKPILWYVKGRHGRRVVHERLTIVPDVLNHRQGDTDAGRALSTKDKSDHAWAQGDAGVSVWIHHLTRRGETIIDPFAGSGTWGRITAGMGRRWIGCDIVAGGTETIMADKPEPAVAA